MNHPCPYCGSTDTLLDSVNFVSTCRRCGEVERLDLFRRCDCGGKMVVHTTKRAGDRKVASMRCTSPTCNKKILTYTQIVEETEGRFPRGKGVTAMAEQMKDWDVTRGGSD